jgi:arginine/lysine/ornithine decarboxylase
MSFISFPTDPNTMNRSELQDNMIQQILDDMDIKTMMAILYDNMSESYDKYSDTELMEEVKEYYPHLLEEETDFGALEATADDYGVGK